jgi:hypothetical protein
MTSQQAARAPRLSTLLIVVAVLALLAYFAWSRRAAPPPVPEPAPVAAVAPAPARPGPWPAIAGLPPGAHYEKGILLDADGRRILNAAGLPPGQPVPNARPIPIDAAPGAVVGYTTQADGSTRPLRAGEMTQPANSPGTYAAVDIFADGGPKVVAPTEGHHLSEAELARARAEEAARDSAQANGR